MQSSELDVLVVGAAGVDTNVYLLGDDVDWSVEANFTENLDCAGQAGGYTSRGYAALGRRVALFAYVGRDALGDLFCTEVGGDGVECHLLEDPRGTNRSVNLMYRDGRRKNFYDAKSALELRPPPETWLPLLQRTRLVHCHIQDWCRAVLPPARDLGRTVACDLQDVVSPDDPYREDFVRGADVLFFSGVNQPDPAPLMQRYLSQGRVRAVIAGLGRHGCLLATREGGVEHFPAVPDERPVVDTNGAGDSLAVGFLSSYVLDGRSLRESVLRGQIAARHACTLRGTSRGLIDTAELDRRQARLAPDGA